MNQDEQIKYWAHMLDESFEPSEKTYFFPDVDVRMNFDEFRRDMDRIALGGKSLYDAYVPDEPVEFEGSRHDIDDYDMWDVYPQNTIGPEEFYRQLEDRLVDAFSGTSVPEKDLAKSISATCEEIAQEALDEYVPDENRGDRLTYGGHRP